MKNKILYIAAVTLSACSFWACDDSENEKAVEVPAVLAGKAYTFDTTDEGEQWKSGKTVGVYMLKGNAAEPISPYQNVKYQTTVEPVGYFTPEMKENVLYYPQDGSKVDIVAYYPWKENLTNDCYPINVSNQAVASNYNLLYAANGKGLSKDNNKVTLQLRPVLSQLLFRLQAGDGVTPASFEGASISMEGMNTKADFNLLSGKLNAASEVKNIACAVTPESNEASAQVIPAASTEGYRVVVTVPNLGGRTYEWVISEDIASFEGGIRYLNTLIISLEKIEVITEASPIEDWQEGNPNTGSGVENAIVNLIEYLPVGQKLPFGMKDPIKNMLEGTWFSTTGASDTPDETKVVSIVEPDETVGRNIIRTTFGAGNNLWCCAGYRMKNAKAQVYTLRFRAKGATNTSIRCYIKTNAGKFIVANNKSTTATPYDGYVLARLTPEYQDFALDFNFSTMVPSAYSYTEKDLLDVTPVALANFFVAFGSNSNIKEGWDLCLDNVSLAKKQ